MIALKNRYKTMSIMDQETFVWLVMALGLKNVPPTCQWIVSLTFQEYLRIFMKLFMEDFNVFNVRKTHLAKLHLCFDKCHKFNINLNLDKCTCLVYYKVILRYIISRGRQTIESKEHFNNGQHVLLKTFKDIQVSNDMA